MDVPRIDDVFDGQHYHMLCWKWVHIDGQWYEHHFFCDPHDITLGLMTDRFHIFKHQPNGGTTCWPIIAINYNLPPEEHTKLCNILPLAIVPGPKAPKDFNTFLQPLVDEMKKLTIGEWTFNSSTNESFKLSAYLISFHGDMVATKYIMNFRGPNGISPCSLCHITGIWNPQGPTTHYVPHTLPCDQAPMCTTYWDSMEAQCHSNSDYFNTLLLFSMKGEGSPH